MNPEIQVVYRLAVFEHVHVLVRNSATAGNPTL
jgi:hypothetical protein